VPHLDCHGFSVHKNFEKNTIDLQWKMRANYNARLCASGRKSRERGNNGKQWKKQCAERSEQSENPGECMQLVGHRFLLVGCANANARPPLPASGRCSGRSISASRGGQSSH